MVTLSQGVLGGVYHWPNARPATFSGVQSLIVWLLHVATAVLVAGATNWYGKLTSQNHASILLPPHGYLSRL